jgi:hypothetical protein
MGARLHLEQLPSVPTRITSTQHTINLINLNLLLSYLHRHHLLVLISLHQVCNSPKVLSSAQSARYKYLHSPFRLLTLLHKCSHYHGHSHHHPQRNHQRWPPCRSSSHRTARRHRHGLGLSRPVRVCLLCCPGRKYMQRLVL